MRVLSPARFILLLVTLVFIGACREEAKVADESPVEAGTEVNLDEVFQWKKTCVLMPDELESKLLPLAKIPEAYWLDKNKSFSKPSQCIKADLARAFQLNCVIFGNKFHSPAFIRVMWKTDRLDYIIIHYVAEGSGKEASPALLASIAESLGAPPAVQQSDGTFHWSGEHYKGSGFFSRSNGEPRFFVTVRPNLSTVKPSGAVATTTAVTVNLDHYIDWRTPKSTTYEEFTAKVATFEKSNGGTLRRSGTGQSMTYYFDTLLGMNRVGYMMLGGQFRPKWAYFSWKDGRLHNSRIGLAPDTGGLGAGALDPEQSMAFLDKHFGVSRRLMQDGAHGWSLGDQQMRFYKFTNAPDYCIEFDNWPMSGAPALSAVASAPATATPQPPAPASDYFKLKISQINGLLISPLATGEEAGQSTKMTLTALPDRGKDQTMLEFNQEVGGDMRRSLLEVAKHSQIRHNDWPLGYTLQIGFADKYIEKDGPSAAVASALLVESAITGAKWDPAFAVTGDMNADGSVQPIGGVRAKVRGATKGGCRVVAVPHKNESLVRDILVLDGPAPLAMIAVFGIQTFEDALLLAKTDRPPALRDALANFEAMRPALQRDPRQAGVLLRTPHAIQRLQALLQAAPNCYSAKYLLLHAQGRAPKVLSIGGSIDAAQSSAKGIIDSIENDVESNVKTLKPDEVGTSLNKLRNLRPILDPRVWPYVDGLLDYGDVVRGAILNPVRSGARYVDLVTKARRAASAAQAAFKSLMGSAAVREELGL